MPLRTLPISNIGARHVQPLQRSSFCVWCVGRFAQVLFAQLFPGSSKSLTSMCDRLVLDSSERDDRHGALLDADMTADALVLLERPLKHGEKRRPEIVDLHLIGVTASSISAIQPMRSELPGAPAVSGD